MTMIAVRNPPRGTTDHISFSSLSLYAACPLRYAFKYAEGLPEETVGSSLVLGSAVHSGLQHHFEELLAGNPAPGLDTLLEVFWDSWQSQSENRQIRFGKGEDINDIGRMADRMFRAFQRSDFSRPTGRIIAVEEELRGELIPGVPELLARVDLIVETDSHFTVTDFKTARTNWSADQVTDSAGQLLLYSELVKHLAGGKPIRLGFAVLTKSKMPELIIHPVSLDVRQVERIKRIAARIWWAIKAGHFYPAPSPLQCPTCPFRKRCRAWNG
jgi:putative RecB family exonuclease